MSRWEAWSESESRRAWLGRAIGSVAVARGLVISALAATEGRAGEAAEERLIVRSRRPLDLETPVSVFRQWRTPNNLFFVRSHFGEPAVELSAWSLEITGLVERPLKLSLDELRGMKPAAVPAVLQCSGNGRAFYEPRIPGVPWERGAVGNAEWSGVRLVDLLERAGWKREAGHVHLLGADGPPSPKTPRFLRSLPIDRALDPSTLVATTMNGEPLPILHGGPLRLVVPGWSGNHWIKWLRTITLARDEAPGFYMQTGYRMPKVPAPPGADLKPSDLVPITVLNVKSLIAWPAAGATLPQGRHEVLGVAWTGAGHVTKVEVALGPDGAWSPATLLDVDRPGTWRRWTWTWEARRPGRATLRARATDSNGQTQPERTAWNRSGYLWNGIDEVVCEVD
jgi:sulfite oxidase